MQYQETLLKRKSNRYHILALVTSLWPDNAANSPVQRKGWSSIYTYLLHIICAEMPSLLTEIAPSTFTSSLNGPFLPGHFQATRLLSLEFTLMVIFRLDHFLNVGSYTTQTPPDVLSTLFTSIARCELLWKGLSYEVLSWQMHKDQDAMSPCGEWVHILGSSILPWQWSQSVFNPSVTFGQ